MDRFKHCRSTYCSVLLFLVAAGLLVPKTAPGAVGTREVMAELQWSSDLVRKNATGDLRDRQLAQACEALVRVGDLAGAKAICKEVRDATMSSYLGGLIVGAQTAAGDAAGAAKTAQELKLTNLVEQYPTGVAVALARSGKSDAARTAVAKIDSAAYRGPAYLKLAQVTRDAKDLKAATALIPPDSFTDAGAIVEVYATLGDLAGAQKAAGQVKDLTGELPFRTVRGLAMAGDVKNATALASKFTKREVLHGDAAWTMVAAANAVAGDVEATKASVAKVISGLQKPVAETLVIYAQAKAGDHAGAKTLAAAPKKASQAQATGYAYGMLASAQLAKADLEGARKTLAEARTAVEAMKTKADKATAAASLLRAVTEGPLGIESVGVVMDW